MLGHIITKEDTEKLKVDYVSSADSKIPKKKDT